MPKSEQKIVKKQRKKAKTQGGFKYIAPLKGKQVPIIVNTNAWNYNERRNYCPVEWFEVDRMTR